MIEEVRPVARLDRPAENRVLGGVCRGLAEHIGLDALVVRLAFVLLMVAGGAGFAGYLALWVLVPRREDPDADGTDPVADGTDSVAGGTAQKPRRDWMQLLTYSALTFGLSALTWASGVAQAALWPIVVCGLGAVILWQQADTDRRQRLVRSTTVPLRRMWLRSLFGVVLVVAGIGGFVAQKVNAGDAREVLIATAVILSGMAVIITPWLVRLWQDLDAERRERIRSQERAEMAAHVHDSVLHTLTLIQRSASDPREVQRLARSQERELRTWLYAPQTARDETFTPAVQKIAGEVEDAHGVPLDVVCVGDCPLDERLGAALQAAREAMVNAAKYAEAPVVSVYAEVEGDEVMVFVRDRGKGFDLDGIPGDRMGIRQSIIGRMERNGGHATVRTAPGEGTEVRLRMKRS